MAPEVGERPRGLELRDGPALVRAGRGAPGPARRCGRSHAHAVPRGHGADPGEAGRRAHPHLPRLPRAAQRRPRPLQGRRVVIQGFGNVGSWAGRIVQDLGATVVAVSDVHGAIHSDGGIDEHALAAHVAEGGRVTDFYGVEVITPDELIAAPCDLLIPAALGGMIHQGNAGGRRAADGQGRDHRARPDGQRRRCRTSSTSAGTSPPSTIAWPRP